METVQAFVTELTRVVRNTDLDDPIKFAAFRQVAEERIQKFAESHAAELKKENGLLEIDRNHKATLLASCEKSLGERDAELQHLRELIDRCLPHVRKCKGSDSNLVQDCEKALNGQPGNTTSTEGQ